MDKKIEKKKWPPKKIFVYSISGLLVIFVLYNLIFGDHSSKTNIEINKITVSTVNTGPFQEYIPVTSIVIPIKTVYLDGIEGGRVSKKFVEAGTMVNPGDLLLELENTNLLLDIMRRESDLFQVSNNLRNTRLAMEQNKLSLQGDLIELDYQLRKLQRVYNRNKKLLESNLISDEEFEQSKDDYLYFSKKKSLAIRSFKQDSLFRKTQVKQLEASLGRMQKNMEVAKLKLDNLRIKAPIAGHLTALNAEIGESKKQGERLGQIDVLDGFKIRAGIDEHYLPRIANGQKGEFEFAGDTYSLRIIKIFPEISNGRFDVDLKFDGDEPTGIRRGQTVHIRLELGELSEATLLERGGFYQKTGGQWVFVLDKSGAFATKRNISLGRQNPQVFEVLQGLDPDEQVIISSYDTFGDYDKLVLK
ncbi:MAG: efflux RND transporter periplasmic adaptor subunit [Calditrichaceae bacterium]